MIFDDTGGASLHNQTDGTYSISSTYRNQNRTVVVLSTSTAVYNNWPSINDLQIQEVVQQLSQKAKQHQALMQLRWDLPKPPRPVPGRTQVRARHGFQQMARLPCYRGRRMR